MTRQVSPQKTVRNHQGEVAVAELNRQRAALLELAQDLDLRGKKFERYMSIQLQQLEMAIDDFERERENWRRYKARELHRQEESESPGQGDSEFSTPMAGKIDAKIAVPAPRRNQEFASDQEQRYRDVSAPLKVLISPGEATAMQIGLLLFEISKFHRELGGGGVRFEVQGIRVPSEKFRLKNNQSPPVIGIEAFSFMPLLAYDGRPSGQFEVWESFKLEILQSTLNDRQLLKLFRSGTETPRDHSIRSLALEATRRSDNATTKYDAPQSPLFHGYRKGSPVQPSTTQQLQRVEEVTAYLMRECQLRIHLSLVW